MGNALIYKSKGGKINSSIEKLKMFSGKATKLCTDIGIIHKDALLMEENWLL